MFTDIKVLRPRTIVLIISVVVMTTIVSNFLNFRTELTAPIIQALKENSGGLIHMNLFTYTVFYHVLLISGLLFLIAGLRPRDVGLNLRQLPVAIGVTLSVWAGVQIIEAIAGLLTTGSITPHPLWQQVSATVVIGILIGHLLGTALAEEIIFRGFLLAQSCQHLKHLPRRRQIALAVLVNVIIFSLWHLPGWIMNDLPADLMLTQFGIVAWWGFFFCLIYLATNNLFISVGIHALINAPTLIVQEAFISQIVMAALVLIGLAAMQYRRRIQPRPPLTPASPLSHQQHPTNA